MVGVYTFLQIKAPKSWNSAFYGFNSRTHFLFSTITSVVLSRKWFDKIVVFTDVETWEHLKDFSEIFDEVNFITEKEIPFDIRGTWSVGKMYSYLQMKEPFVHIDNDVYLKTPMVKIYAEQYPVIYQSIEINNYFKGWYQPQFDLVDKYLTDGFLPHFSKEWNYGELAYNAGVFGGSGIEIIHEVYSKVWDFLLAKKPSEDLSCALEQAYPSMYFYNKGITPFCVISEKFAGDRQNKEMARKGYIHLLSDRKRKNGGQQVIDNCKDFLLTNHFGLYQKIIQ